MAFLIKVAWVNTDFVKAFRPSYCWCEMNIWPVEVK
jgi:hypothetical protein